MSLETRITEAANAAVSRLDEEFRTKLAVLSDELRAAAAAAQDETQSAHEAEAAALQHEIATLKGELDERNRRVAELDARLADLDQQSSADKDAHAAALSQLREEADSTLGDAERALVEAVRQAQLQEEQTKAAALVEPAPPVVDQAGAARIQALAQAVSGMDEATTLSEVLDALSSGLLPQAPRSAVLVFQDDRARVWRRNGFPADAPGIGAELHLSDHADLKAIVDGAAPALVEGGSDDALVLGLAPLPAGHLGLAVPVAIGGQTAALVYADGSPDDQLLTPGWTDVVEILARHAARCLETLTAMRAAGYARTQRPAVVVPMPPHLRIVQRPALETSLGDAVEQARRVARLLVSEIRLNREADVMQGREHGDLGTRLGDDIARARRTYFQRVAEGLPGREALFDEELVRTLANGDAALLRTGS